MKEAREAVKAGRTAGERQAEGRRQRRVRHRLGRRCRNREAEYRRRRGEGIEDGEGTGYCC